MGEQILRGRGEGGEDLRGGKVGKDLKEETRNISEGERGKMAFGGSQQGKGGKDLREEKGEKISGRDGGKRS